MRRDKVIDILNGLDMDLLYEALGFYPTIHVRGNDIGKCLFPENHAHGDTTGKLAIHRDKKVYNCWICGGGSIVSLVCQIRRCEPDEALNWLGQFSFHHGDVSDDSFLSCIKELREMPIDPHDLEPMPYFNIRALDIFNGPVDYFRARGISDKVISECHLCFSKSHIRRCPSKIRGEDYEGPVAVFPHFWMGKLVGWQQRWVKYPRVPFWMSKYTNTSSFPKRDTLYNYDWALDQKAPVVVCESVPTTLFLRSIGIPSVAYFGDVPTPGQLKLMRRFSFGAILAPDNDHNGDRLLEVATEYLNPYVEVYHLPKMPKMHGDIGDYATNSDGVNLVLKHLARAYPYYTDGSTIGNI